LHTFSLPGFNAPSNTMYIPYSFVYGTCTITIDTILAVL
jgi:hypothetical protein